MTRYPTQDNAGGIWKLADIANHHLGGFWPDHGSKALTSGGLTPSVSNVIDFFTISTTGNASDFGD